MDNNEKITPQAAEGPLPAHMSNPPKNSGPLPSITPHETEPEKPAIKEEKADSPQGEKEPEKKIHDDESEPEKKAHPHKKRKSKKKKKKGKKMKMPNAYVIVYIALILVVLLTYFVPVSIHDPDTGDVIYNATIDEEGTITKDTGPQPMGLWDVIMAPIKGFQSASDVGIALLVAGGFLNVLAASGGLEAGIGKMLKKLKGNMLIALMMLVCAIMGTVFGFWEEITAFSLVVVPMFVLAGYDVMTGLIILFVGATVGNMASVVNPFATGAAVAAINSPDLTLGSGIILRAILFVVMYVISTFMLIRYASGVKADKSKSVLAGIDGIKDGTSKNATLPEMNKARMWSIVIFVVVVLLLLIGYIPWRDLGGDGLSNAVNSPFLLLSKIPVVGNLFGAGHVTPFGEWGFNEFTLLFFVGSLLLMKVNHMKQDRFIKHFIDGASSLLGIVFVLSISRGIAIVMGDASQGMSVTFVYWISSALANIPLWIFAVFAVICYIAIGVFLQSSSGVAGISMPILGAVASSLFAGAVIGSVGGQIILISAFNLGLSFMCAIYPGAENLGTTALFKVPFGVYLRVMLKFTIPLMLAATIILSLAPYLGLAF